MARNNALFVKHGLTGHPLYKTWGNMKSRCYRKSYPCFKDYGGRGIIVCDEWRNDFMSFYSWAIENGWRKGLELDRINVNGNYCPENCRWATDLEQGQNKRNSRWLEHGDKKMILADWARHLSLPETTIYSRLSRGWDLERILTTGNTMPNRKTKYKDNGNKD